MQPSQSQLTIRTTIINLLANIIFILFIYDFNHKDVSWRIMQLLSAVTLHSFDVLISFCLWLIAGARSILANNELLLCFYSNN